VSGLTFQEWTQDVDTSRSPVSMIINSSELRAGGFKLKSGRSLTTLVPNVGEEMLGFRLKRNVGFQDGSLRDGSLVRGNSGMDPLKDHDSDGRQVANRMVGRLST
jgi:hypothetical protein